MCSYFIYEFHESYNGCGTGYFSFLQFTFIHILFKSNIVLIFFSIIVGNLLDEATVLEWMISQKNDASIEDITREQLFKYIETKEFLAVVFCMLLFI